MGCFTILGAGAWGTAISLVLGQKSEHEVSLWSARPEKAKELHARRENVRLLPGIPIPEHIRLTTEPQACLEKPDLIIVAVPTAYLRGVLAKVAGMIPASAPVCSLTKGLEFSTFLRPTQIIQDVWGPRPVAVLSGPSHAEEVARGAPTSLVAASEDLGLARWIQERFSTERFRVYTNLDIIGVELAGALKNVMGIAAGMCDGLGFGDNAKAALLTRGLAEMARFGVAMGGEHQTFWGLAGMGDLITTCFSRHGRNRAVGERLGKGEKIADILATMEMVAEGVNTTRSLHERAKQMGISMPITAEVYRVLYENKQPRDVVADLMLRKPKSEGV
jgi:glycerol-3-phosphate dehydrogenase (NAD(P)+)